MSIQFLDTYLKDQILSVITAYAPFSIFEIGQAYKRLQSFDRLLSCIDIATKQQKGLPAIVDILVGEQNNER